MKEISRREAERMWGEATPVEVERRPGGLNTVLSIRMTSDLLGELELAARGQGKGPTTLARELIEQGLAAGPPAPGPLPAQVGRPPGGAPAAAPRPRPRPPARPDAPRSAAFKTRRRPPRR